MQSNPSNGGLTTSKFSTIDRWWHKAGWSHSKHGNWISRTNWPFDNKENTVLVDLDFTIFASLLRWKKLKGKNNLLEIYHCSTRWNSTIRVSASIYLSCTFTRSTKIMQCYVLKSASLSSFRCSWMKESTTFLSDTCHPKIRYIPSNEK